MTTGLRTPETGSCETAPPEPWTARFGDRGYIMALTALLLVPIIIAAAFAIDVGAWYAQAVRIQRAADAASLAGVAYLPDQAKAIQAALGAAASNGYSSANCPGSGSVRVCVTPVGTKQQLSVSITAPGMIFLGRAAGVANEPLTRSATAEYIPSIPMGSPISQMGNDPVLGYKPDFWLGQDGVANQKGNGDRYADVSCNTPAGSGSTTMWGCSGTYAPSPSLADNDEYLSSGYLYVIRVPASAAGQTVDVEAFDPAFFNSAKDCSVNNTGGATSSCTGDNMSNSGSLLNNTACVDGADYSKPDNLANLVCTPTTYIVRGPDASNPNLVSHPAICGITYKGYNVDSPATRATPVDPYANVAPSSIFHKWSRICRITSAVAGDYVVQVKTNADLSNRGSTPATTATAGLDIGTTGNAATRVYVGGQNNFSLRAGISGQTAGSAAWSAGIALFADGKLPIYVNSANAAPNFYLARITGAYQGTTLVFDYFDIGDGSGPEKVTLTPPGDATNAPTSCTWTRDGGAMTGATVAGCSAGNLTSANYNGRLTSVKVSVPATYTCNEASATGCWFKITIETDAPNDFTTWSARVIGDPVHLVK